MHSEYFILNKKDAKKMSSKRSKYDEDPAITFFVPYDIPSGEDKISDENYYTINIISDRWFQAVSWKQIDLCDIEVPDEDYPHT